ncbi:MAG: hypothetical protein E7168_00785 [Firmicutes bacterium]|nr:hypothetical protein [Bacillota bacterium]
MVTGHEIRKEDQEEVLVLHLTYDSEYSVDFFKEKERKTMKEHIDEYIQRNNLSWQGEKIHLMYGGIHVGSVSAFYHPFSEGKLNYVYDDEPIEII